MTKLTIRKTFRGTVKARLTGRLVDVANIIIEVMRQNKEFRLTIIAACDEFRKRFGDDFE